MNYKSKQKDNISRVIGPKVFEKNKVIQVPFEENPFENAMKENAKIENKLEQDRLKLIEFDKKVKERIRAYKFAERKLEQDAQLIIHKKSVLYTSKKKNSNFMRSKSALDISQISKSSTSLSCSDENLSNFALKTIQNEANIKELYKKRIKSTRKIYSNMERDKIRNEMLTKDSKNVLIQKESKTKHRNNFKIEKNKECQTVPKMESNQELKNFINEEPVKEKPCLQVKKAVNNHLKTQSKLEKYISYMKELLRQKSNVNKLDIPPICQCHLNSKNKSIMAIWDIDFTKCANNCLFYQNPKGNLYFFIYKKVKFDMKT